jgi:hypothetical protein
MNHLDADLASGLKDPDEMTTEEVHRYYSLFDCIEVYRRRLDSIMERNGFNQETTDEELLKWSEDFLAKNKPPKKHDPDLWFSMEYHLAQYMHVLLELSEEKD